MQNLSEKRLDVEAATSVNVKVRKQKDFRANQENDGNWEDCYCIECPECGGELLLPISLENEKFISHPSCKKSISKSSVSATIVYNIQIGQEHKVLGLGTCCYCVARGSVRKVRNGIGCVAASGCIQ